MYDQLGTLYIKGLKAMLNILKIELFAKGRWATVLSETTKIKIMKKMLI